MTVKEVEELEPQADICELSCDERYLIIVPDINASSAKMLRETLHQQGISAVIVSGIKVKVYGLERTKEK